MKQIIDINKDKITETQQLKIEISKLKVNIHMLNKELEENKNNKYFTKEKLNQFKNQIIKAKNTRKPKSYKNWVEEFKQYDFNSEKKK